MAYKDKNVTYVKLPDRLGWMVTFSDLVTLLLTFFVMIIAMSSMDSKVLKDSFGFFSAVNGPLEFPQEHEVKIVQPVVKTAPDIMALNVESLKRSLMISLKKQNIVNIPGRGIDMGDVKETNRGFAIAVPDGVVFDKGSKELKKDAEPMLKGVADAVRGIDVTIAIEGHTDNLGNEQSNWRLSLSRAISIADYFVYNQGLSPERVCVAGYGSKRPVATNETQTGRDRNRRVEIILLKDRL